MNTLPETRYAKSGDVSIAYQVTGQGPLDLVAVPGFVSNLDALWEYPPAARGLERLASFARLIRFDKRGTGLSDRFAQIPTLAADGRRASSHGCRGLRTGRPLRPLRTGSHVAPVRGHIPGAHIGAGALRVLCQAILGTRSSLGPNRGRVEEGLRRHRA
jgi:pimeloyl-ACP methyl ester carboxylesterase